VPAAEVATVEEVADPLPFITTLLAAMDALVAPDSLAQLQPLPTTATVPVALVLSMEPGLSRRAIPEAPAAPVAQFPALKPLPPNPPSAKAGAEMEADKTVITNAVRSFTGSNSNPPFRGTTETA
jgi:hypothetical protein